MNRYRISTSVCEHVLLFNCLASSEEEAVKVFEEQIPEKTRQHYTWAGDPPTVINLDEPPTWLAQDKELLERFRDRWDNWSWYASHGI